MSNLGNAYVLAGELYIKDETLPFEDRSANLHRCIEIVGFGCDERKADLYAQLEENLEAGTPYQEAVLIIEAAMDNTNKRYPHG